jgi:hypothetical protein
MSFESLKAKLGDCLNQLSQLEQKYTFKEETVLKQLPSNRHQLRETIEFLKSEVEKGNIMENDNDKNKFALHKLLDDSLLGSLSFYKVLLTNDFVVSRDGDLLYGIRNNENKILNCYLTINDKIIKTFQVKPNETKLFFDGYPIPLIKLAFHQLHIHLLCDDLKYQSYNIELIYGFLQKNEKKELCINSSLLFDNDNEQCMVFCSGMMTDLCKSSKKMIGNWFKINEPIMK